MVGAGGDSAKNVYLWGIFDVLHEGHERLFEEAEKMGNVHVIVVPAERTPHKRLVFDDETRRKNVLNSPRVKAAYLDTFPELSCFNASPPDVFCSGYDQDDEWDEKIKELIKSRFPACRFVTMDEYADVHSSDLRETIGCPCGSGKLWKDCHAING